MDREKCENALETLKDFLRQTIFIEKEATASKISEAEVILFELIEKHEQLEERYKLLKESYDELLGNAVKLQEGICPLCENYECKNPPLKFEEPEPPIRLFDKYDIQPFKKVMVVKNIEVIKKEVKEDE